LNWNAHAPSGGCWQSRPRHVWNRQQHQQHFHPSTSSLQYTTVFNNVDVQPLMSSVTVSCTLGTVMTSHLIPTHGLSCAFRPCENSLGRAYSTYKSTSAKYFRCTSFCRFQGAHEGLCSLPSRHVRPRHPVDNELITAAEYDDNMSVHSASNLPTSYMLVALVSRC
jgi:hypothetical protein